VSAPELALELPGCGRVLFTERSHGNLSSVAGDGAENGARARERLRAQIGVERLARGHQVHGRVVRSVTTLAQAVEAPTEELAADGQATALRGVAPMVLAADCLPVALGHGGAVAMIHAGWRGLAAGVLEQGVRVLQGLGDGERILAVVGPCAGVCCYEVGPEVHAAFAGTDRLASNLDLRGIAHQRLLAAGAAEVRDLEACTICDERFFSHRRERERAGRQAGVAWLS
jgi:purine-nucleoside/S-methyl-5'-thioadenosine phosphorylase / adenosine deaminase